MIHTTLDNFFLDDEALENSPSRRSGIDRDTENSLRHYGCELIQEAGILLGFQQVVMATGQVLFHRFYCKRSMKEYNVKKLAATALWQGAKLEEAPEVSGHPRELLNKIMVAVDRCIARREIPEGRKLAVLDLHSKESEEFRRSLIRYEIEMLKAFGFITHVEHPHKLLLNYVQLLGLALGQDQEDAQFPGFVQQAWNIANDSLRTTLCVRFKSSIIACGIIFYTSRKLKVPLPESPPWWDIFGVKLPQIYEVCAALHQLYSAPRAQFIPVCHQIVPSKPPTPATADAAAGGTAGGATPTPMQGRPAKPLDPSVRVPVGDGTSGATPGQANGSGFTPAVVGSGSTPAAARTTAAASNPTSAAPSPQQVAPGSAQKRKDRSPPVEDSYKRQRGDSAQPQQQPGASEQDSQQPRQDLKQPLSRGSMRSRSRSRSRSRDRVRDRGAVVKPSSSRRHSRSRSRSRERSYHRESSRGDGGARPDSRYDRERDRRDRERSHQHSRSREYADRDRDRDRPRESYRERREGDKRDRRDSDRDRPVSGGDRDRMAGVDRERADKEKRPGSDRVPSRLKEQDGKQQQQPTESDYPPPPAAGPGSKLSSLPGAAAVDNSKQAKGSASPGSTAAGSREQHHEERNSKDPDRADKPTSPRLVDGSKPFGADSAMPPKPKPVAVRKKPLQQYTAADKPADGPDTARS